MPDVILTTDHPRAQCVDLRATFAGQFRFRWDPAYEAERSDYRRVERAWLTIIPCAGTGKIFPWGGRTLAAYSSSRRRRLMAVPGVTIVQGGGTCREVIVTFDVSLIESIAEVLSARRPRKLTPEERERLSARMRTVNEARLKARNEGGG